MNDDDRAQREAARIQAQALEHHKAQQPAANAVSLTYCEDCGNEIPQERREAIIGVRQCVDCKAAEEHKNNLYG
jgi:phage/conjugal plasmid C-4 type zinc finger TraR family protein